ncbi:hypothetical protein V492_07632 [Pseudogymnoascus sp. VKM F-4246]|nr:hypothetical protein V492_07632 [Pseudogymnoascus sp. VKM F-4246]
MFQRAIATAPRAAARALSTQTRAFGPSSARIATPVIANRIANGRRQYHEKVLDHYSRPRNVGSMSKADTDVGTGLVGAPACGDVMKLQIRVDPTNNTISDVKFKTFGCGSAIASSSYLTELVRGMTLEEAGRVRNTEIAKELCLPPVKLHCSMLAEDAIKSAISNYYTKNPETQATNLGGTGSSLPKIDIETVTQGSSATAESPELFFDLASFLVGTLRKLTALTHLHNRAIMVKRALEETEVAAASAGIPTSVPAKKKSRKEAKSDDNGANGADDTVKETKEERKERKRREKKEKRALEQDSDASPEDLAALKKEKAEKKALKKAKKAEKAEPASVTPPSTESTTPAETTSNGSYTPSADLAGLPQSKVDQFLADNFINITDPTSQALLRPIIDFAYLPITDPKQRAPFKDFKSPTPIQAAAWPFLLAGRDVIGVAETGSGKTMAFAVPCIRHISEQPKFKGAKAVVVSPTRELAMQSYEQINKLAALSGMQAVCVYGGVAKDEQRRALKTADIVVATPGRLNDLINEGSANLSKVSYVVLDEADRMLDKGFEEEIRKIINTARPLGERQTLMFTATWPESVRALASTFMTSPIKIAIGDNPTGDLRANTRIVQKVEVVDPRGKEYRLLQILKEHQSGSQKDDRIIVFCLYKKEATRVEGFLRSKGIRVAGIHGDLSQEQRTKSLDAFKKGTTPVLVATDVAARGLDIPAVKLVLNCTFPLTVEDYVHRIGRTGRAGKEGLAITLFTEHDKAQSGALINVLKAANQPVPDELLKFGTTVKKKGHEAYGAFFKDVDTSKAATKIKFD